MDIKINKKRLLIVIITFVIILLLSFLYYYIYNKYNIGIKCIFHEITGLYCPGCGITRAIFSLMELDIIKAIKYNLLIITVIPVIIYYYIVKILNWITQKEKKDIIPNKVWYVILILVIVFGVLRNIDYFSFLAP